MTYDAVHPNPDIAKRLKAIYSLHRKEMDFRLERSPYNDLLAALGDPQDRLPPVIHLAGTNGKGSTLSFLRSVYETAGYRVHTYTSPHLLTFNERIALNGRQISDERLLYYLETVEAANAGRPVTFFEYTTALAFCAFADHEADICLLETGLGGRLDCTNIIRDPAATILTQIGSDHTDFLGHKIEDIAGEKGGIMKPGAPCIVARQPFYAQIADILIKKATETGCPLLMEGRDWFAAQADIPALRLTGGHQRDNAATAMQAVAVLQGRFPVNAGDIRSGLADTRWPARMENVTQGRIAESLPPAWSLWFDCGHNESGALTIAAQLAQWKKGDPNRPVHLILGLAGDKDAAAFMAPLWEHVDSLTYVDLMNARKPRSGEALRQALGRADIAVSPSVSDAVDTLKKAKPQPALLLVAGSLYLYSSIF